MHLPGRFEQRMHLPGRFEQQQAVEHEALLDGLLERHA
jgi:hypothetical protein